MVVAASRPAVAASPSTRIACSPCPSSARPEPRLAFVARSCVFTCGAVMPKLSSFTGSSSTRISRSAPP